MSVCYPYGEQQDILDPFHDMFEKQIDSSRHDMVTDEACDLIDFSHDTQANPESTNICSFNIRSSKQRRKVYGDLKQDKESTNHRV